MNDVIQQSEEYCQVERELKDESIEKTDSGMDEDMTENSPDVDCSSDDDDVVISRKTTRKKVIIDDDEDEEEVEKIEEDVNGVSGSDDDDEDDVIISRRTTKKKVIIDDDDDDDDEEDLSIEEDDNDAGSDKDEVIISKKATNKKVIIDEDEEEKEKNIEEEEENVDERKSLTKNHEKKTVSEALDAILNSDSEDEGPNVGQILDDSDKDEEQNTIKRKKKKSKIPCEKNTEDDTISDHQLQKPNLFNSDLYDAEDSDEDDTVPSRSPDVSDNDLDDEGFDDDDIDPILKAKLLKMKGATRETKERKDRKAKPKRDDLLGLHSETQRLIRESSVSIPYHHPTPKSLTDFLASASKKQQEYKALRGAKEFKKPHVIEHVLANITPDELPRVRKPRVRSESARRRKHQANMSESENDACDKDIPTPSVDTLSQQNVVSLDAAKRTLSYESNDELPDADKRTLSYESDDELPEVSLDNENNSKMLGDVSEIHSDNTHCESDNFTAINEHKEISNCVADDKEMNTGSMDADSDSFKPGDLSVSDVDEGCRLVLRLDSENSAKHSEDSQMNRVYESGILITENDSVLNTRKGNTEIFMENEDNTFNSQNEANELNSRNADRKSSPQSEANELNALPTDTKMYAANEDSNMEIDNETNAENNDGEVRSVDNVDAAYSELISDDEDENTSQTDKHEAQATVVKKTPVREFIPELTDIKPRLSGDSSSFINLDEDENETPKNPGLVSLMDRFIQHSKKKKHKPKKDVDISIVQKESGTGDKDDLKLTSFTYHVEDEEEEDPKLHTPGAKLLKLKDQLKVQIKVKREEARQKRVEMYELENEEGFVDDEEEAILDNEDELSEKTDTDVEDEEFDEQFGNEEDDDKETEDNPFIDGEADEDVEDDDSGDDSEENDDNPSTMKLRLDSSDDDNSHDNIVKKKHAKRPKKLAISDDDESRQSAPTDKEDQTIKDITANEVRSFSSVTMKDHIEDTQDGLSPLSKHLSATQTQKPRMMSCLSLPIEDSQDLYDDTQSGSLSMAGLTSKATQSMESLNFSMEDSQSQMLDADGFLKVGTSLKKPSKQSLNFIDESSRVSSSQDNMDELLGLCSGKFVDPQEDGKKISCKNLFGDSLKSNTNADMDELLGLCSGFFPASCPENDKNKTSGSGTCKVADEQHSNASFSLLSDGEDNMESEKELSDDEETNDNLEEIDEELPESPSAKRKHFRGFIGKKTKKIRQAFVEEEAELSGSEYDSDENLDLAEEDDIMEMEEGDLDNSISEEDLREQVGRVHLKRTIDEDKRDIMRLQEMYLPDGDLYSDGKGRMRRFKWNNLDEESQEDMFGNHSDEEGHEEENADELKWRMERFEREKFLEEQREKEEHENEDSQLLKLGKMFLLRQVSSEKKETEFKKPQQPNKSPSKVFRPSISRKGSFLNRSKAALAHIAARSKVAVNPTGPTNSKNFVFTVMSPDKVQAKSESVSNSAATKKRKSLVQNQSAKRQKTGSISSTQSKSIFHLLER